MGGLGVRDISVMHELEYGWSLLIFHTLKSVDSREEAMQETIRTIVLQKSNFWAAIYESIKASGPSILLYTIPYAREKCASLWLSARPIESEDCRLSPHEFRDAVNSRYGLTCSDVPLSCICRQPNNVAHALS
ncbi:hypothetical protein GJ496_005503 [Pomphorhynchus laevis]|nr:hypothetical protein GJ496_005503 [Pomphorhynchus laevis]